MKNIACVLLLLAGLWPNLGWAQKTVNADVWTYPDGTVKIFYPDGSTKTTNPDGSIKTTPPSLTNPREEPQTFVQASFDFANQYIKEKTKYAQFISEDKRVFALNVHIYRGDFDRAKRIMDNFSKRSEPYRQDGPPELSTLVASNDTLPGPAVSAPNRTSWGQLGLFYGVQLIGKGSGSTGGATRMTYLEPLAYVTYSYALPDNKGRLFAGLGPYIAYGLWGKIKSGSYSANTFDGQTGYGRFDAGLYVTAGYQLPQGLRLSIAREIGFVNINKNNPDEKVFNRVWSLNVAYPLKKLVALVKKK